MTALTIAACVVGYWLVGVLVTILVECASGTPSNWEERLSYAPFWLPVALLMLWHVIAEDFREPRK